MYSDPVLEAIAREYADFCLEDGPDAAPEPEESMCVYARIFRQWGEGLLTAYVRTDPTPVRLAQAKVLLIDRYFEWRVSVPKSHRNRIADHGHVCIFHTFEYLYQQIKLVQLTITPPLVLVPSPPSAPIQPQIHGIFWGEDVGAP